MGRHLRPPPPARAARPRLTRVVTTRQGQEGGPDSRALTRWKGTSAIASPYIPGNLAERTTDRRRVLQLATALGLTTALGGTRHTAARQPVAPDIPATTHTWLIDSPDALRPPAPGEPTADEIAELLDFQERRSDQAMQAVSSWGARQAVLPWNELLTQLVIQADLPALLEFRANCLVRTAMHDAVVAALDAQQAHARPAPATVDDRIETIGDTAATSSFPSVHAAIAGAASTVLAYLFPDLSDDGFASVADEAATSRLWAGAAFRSDIEAGLTIGRSVGALAIAWGQADGSDEEWDGSNWPTGEGFYERTPPNFADPFAPLAGTWATWVLPSGDAIRPAPFPEVGSLAFDCELDAIRRTTERRTAAEERIIDFWLSHGPDGYFASYAMSLIERENLDELEAASVLGPRDGRYRDLRQTDRCPGRQVPLLGGPSGHHGSGAPSLHSHPALPLVPRRVRRRIVRRRDRAGGLLPGRSRGPAVGGGGGGGTARLGGHPLRAGRRCRPPDGWPGRTHDGRHGPRCGLSAQEKLQGDLP